MPDRYQPLRDAIAAEQRGLEAGDTAPVNAAFSDRGMLRALLDERDALKEAGEAIFAWDCCVKGEIGTFADRSAKYDKALAMLRAALADGEEA